MAALRLATETEILAELGIRQIGQLLFLPRDALAARFTPQLLLRLDQALGNVPETIISHRPPPDITAEVQLEFATDDRRVIDILLSRLIERIVGTLVQRQQGAIQIQCEFRCERGVPVHILVGLFRASAQARHLLELARMRLERLILPAPVVAIKVSVLTAARWQMVFARSF